MFDLNQSGRMAVTGLATSDDPAPVPLERLEAQICELAGHLTAATCQFLILLGDFDDRRGWGSWDFPSCAAWLSWKCQMASGTARVRRRLAWRFDDDGSLAATIRLPPLQGAVLLQALRAAAGDVDHPHDPDGMISGHTGCRTSRSRTCTVRTQ